MKIVIQRVKRASVTADGVPAGKCGHGLLLLVGVVPTDTARDAELLAAKISKMRIFTDDADKMNLSVLDIGGSVLAVSNFTLAADISPVLHRRGKARGCKSALRALLRRAPRGGRSGRDRRLRRGHADRDGLRRTGDDRGRFRDVESVSR